MLKGLAIIFVVTGLNSAHADGTLQSDEMITIIPNTVRTVVNQAGSLEEKVRVCALNHDWTLHLRTIKKDSKFTISDAKQISFVDLSLEQVAADIKYLFNADIEIKDRTKSDVAKELRERFGVHYENIFAWRIDISSWATGKKYTLDCYSSENVVFGEILQFLARNGHLRLLSEM